MTTKDLCETCEHSKGGGAKTVFGDEIPLCSHHIVLAMNDNYPVFGFHVRASNGPCGKDGRLYELRDEPKKFCQDCRWSEYLGVFGVLYCKHQLNVEPVMGYCNGDAPITLFPCEDERASDEKCGPDGAFWEAKDE